MKHLLLTTIAAVVFAVCATMSPPDYSLSDAIKKGDIISYVKILNKPGVRPIEMARKSEIDTSKYMEFMESTLDQLTSSMDLDFDTILGKPKQTGLEQFFWN